MAEALLPVLYPTTLPRRSFPGPGPVPAHEYSVNLLRLLKVYEPSAVPIITVSHRRFRGVYIKRAGWDSCLTDLLMSSAGGYV